MANKIQLQFVRGKTLTSQLIAWWGSGYGGFSHVDAVLSTGGLLGARADRIGGVPPGVQIRTQGYEAWSERLVLTLPVKPSVASTWEKFLLKQVGIQYDEGAIWGFIFGQRSADPGRWICSALQTGALQEVNLMPSLLVPPSQITPDTLAELFVAIGATKGASS